MCVVSVCVCLCVWSKKGKYDTRSACARIPRTCSKGEHPDNNNLDKAASYFFLFPYLTHCQLDRVTFDTIQLLYTIQRDEKIKNTSSFFCEFC